MCRINPKIDFAFKKLFGSEENKDLLISLINSVVDPDDLVEDLILKNPYNLADYKADKMSILDIKARGRDGTWFNVEMQVGEDFDYDKRSIYYWSKLVTEQLTEGQLYKHLDKTICINFMDFNVIHGNPDFHNIYKILNAATGKSDDMHDMFELHYIELRKFTKDLPQVVTALDRWTTFLAKAHLLDKNNLPEQISSDQSIVKAVTAVDRMFDEEERLIYQVRLEKQMEMEQKISSALDKGRREGLEMGLAEGMEKGMEKGIEKGMRKGIEKGELNKAKDAAIRMLADGMNPKTIATYTGLNIEQVRELERAEG